MSRECCRGLLRQEFSWSREGHARRCQDGVREVMDREGNGGRMEPGGRGADPMGPGTSAHALEKAMKDLAIGE